MKSARQTSKIIESLRGPKPATRELRLEAATRLEEYDDVFADMAKRITLLTKKIKRLDSGRI